MSKILFFKILCVFVCYAETGMQLKNPITNAYDFSYENNVNESIQNFKKEDTLEKVLIPISKQNTITRRDNYIFSCMNDSYGSVYCPAALAPANKYSTYQESTVIEKTNSVVDYEIGSYQELTSTVRDFMDGYSSVHNSTVTDFQTGSGIQNIGSVIDYQSNSISTKLSNTVVDYTEKVPSINVQVASSTCLRSTGSLIPESPSGQWYSYVPAWAGSNGAGWEVYINKVGATTYKIYYRLEAYYRWTGWKTAYIEEGSAFQDSYYNRGDYGGFRVDLKTAVFYGLHPKTLGQVAIGDLQNMPVCKSCGSNLSASQLTQTYLPNLGTMGWLLNTSIGGSSILLELSTDKTKYFYKIQAGNGTPVSNSGAFSGGIVDSTYYNDGKNDYSINFILSQSYIKVGSFGSYTDIYSFNDLVCFINQMNCPSDYNDNGTNCQKDISYNYYTYSCPSDYTPIDYGISNFTKTDPDTTKVNDYTLDDDVNSPTPPPSNCKKTITYSFYKYDCPSGYTVNDNGLTSSCPKVDPDTTTNDEGLLSQPCNSSTPPQGNCTKIIPYTYYSYECNAGYTAIDQGLSSCSKNDSNLISDSTLGLEQSCNNSTPSASNCYKDIDYKHYTYGCSPGYVTDNYGLSTCSKTDLDKSKNNSDSLDDPCNSATPPVGNCKKTYSYKYYEYQCSGKNSFNEDWKVQDAGLSSCNKTDSNKNTVNTELADDCNSSVAPIHNCIAAEYNCGQNDGEILLKDSVEYDNGIATKYQSSFTDYKNKNADNNCPTNYVETTGTEREKGECKLDTVYFYNVYSCSSEPNQYGYNWEVQDKGGNCNPVSLIQLLDVNKDGIGDSCNSNIPPSQNCIRKTFEALPGLNAPVFVDNQWQCSPFSCNSSKKCGYGICPMGTTASTTLFQDIAYSPLTPANNGLCTNEICDYVKNSKISYCVSQQCPTGPEYVTKDGNCYKEECPKGTYMSGSKCISSSY